MTEKQNLLVKLHRGEITKEEVERLMELIQSKPEANDEKVMEELWKALEITSKLEKSDSDFILKRTLNLIDREENNKHQPRSNKPSLLLSAKVRRLLLGSAAAIAIAIMGTFTWLQIDKQRTVTLSTNFGEQLEFTLPDQSTVTLNSNSKISYRKHWGDVESRQVNLQGEAFFEVRKNPEIEQKFEVFTSDLRVEVLGTTFNVNARGEETTVFLEEGKVNLDLEDREDDIDMIPGDLVTYSRKTRVPQKNQIVAEVPASWKDGTVEFEDSQLQDILQRLKEIYGIEIIYENKASLDRRYRISLPLQSLDMAFAVLKEVTGLNLTKNKNAITVK